MKSKIIKICFVVISAIIVFSLYANIVSAGNASREDGSKMTYISQYNGTIDHGALSTTVTAKIVGKTDVTSVKIKMELQKLSGGTYSTVETWEQTFSGRLGDMEESKLTNPLSTYRLKATFTAYCGTASETKILYVDET